MIGTFVGREWVHSFRNVLELKMRSKPLEYEDNLRVRTVRVRKNRLSDGSKRPR